jgi:hypothetical protein
MRPRSTAKASSCAARRARCGRLREREEIQRVYYPEMEALARVRQRRSRAIVFDHLVRRRAPGTLTPFGARDGQRPSAATRVHCDFTPASAQRRLALEMEARGIGQVSRFAILNLWRTTRLPVLDAPLAVCDARTVRPADLVAADIVYPTRTGEIFEVLYNPAHAWTYFHGMQFDEVLLFKQYDSAGVSMPCYPHAARRRSRIRPRRPARRRARASRSAASSSSTELRDSSMGALHLAYVRDPDGNKLCAVYRLK